MSTILGWLLILLIGALLIKLAHWLGRDDTRISRYEISTSVRDTDDWRRARARRRK